MDAILNTLSIIWYIIADIFIKSVTDPEPVTIGLALLIIGCVAFLFLLVLRFFTREKDPPEIGNT